MERVGSVMMMRVCGCLVWAFSTSCRDATRTLTNAKLEFSSAGVCGFVASAQKLRFLNFGRRERLQVDQLRSLSRYVCSRFVCALSLCFTCSTTSSTGLGGFPPMRLEVVHMDV